MMRNRAEIVVATSTASENDSIQTWCADKEVAVFRGDELDVLDRYYQCATAFSFDNIVRLTADNPFTDIEELDRLIDFHVDGAYDYTHAFGQLPVGVGAEIFTFEALALSHRDGHLPHQREHVNEYFTDHPRHFRIAELPIPEAKRAPGLRLTVDTYEDWERADNLVKLASQEWLGTEEAIRLCSYSA
ncbi:Spore coat polysaccharide biosynthesis protein SpsF (plasmid) [Neorhizobium galegae bv. officinalis bv. officinalis str. HAMBI 1141]|uniref:Spore coat polysaccharide biosynthesis protein SpsF n=2 Tax=Neorhizobium galegae TaxID=399 RepID=A0A068TFR0_NEOGA|nr:Spore coat polysaccharide biosynthesis protein SpsF [Neorhizobium galegae bv. officinalis bv. officinalis str. HAMBI 1141]